LRGPKKKKRTNSNGKKKKKKNVDVGQSIENQEQK
jgi:hypothetical protein